MNCETYTSKILTSLKVLLRYIESLRKEPSSRNVEKIKSIVVFASVCLNECMVDMSTIYNLLNDSVQRYSYIYLASNTQRVDDNISSVHGTLKILIETSHNDNYSVCCMSTHSQ